MEISMHGGDNFLKGWKMIVTIVQRRGSRWKSCWQKHEYVLSLILRKYLDALKTVDVFFFLGDALILRNNTTTSIKPLINTDGQFLHWSTVRWRRQRKKTITLAEYEKGSHLVSVYLSSIEWNRRRLNYFTMLPFGTEDPLYIYQVIMRRFIEVLKCFQLVRSTIKVITV